MTAAESAGAGGAAEAVGVADRELADAFLLLVADEPGRARRSVPADDWRFLQTDVWPRLQAAPVAVEAGERAARLAVQELLRAFTVGDRDAVRERLAEFEREHARSQAARGAAGLRSRLVSWLEQGEQRDPGLRTLAARAPQTFRVGRDEEGGLWCAGEVGRSDSVRVDEAWELDGEARSHRRSAPIGAGLRVPSPFPLGVAIEAEVELRIPMRGREPSLVWLDVHEGWVAFAVLPSGVVVAAVPDGAVQPGDGAGLGRALAGSIREVVATRRAVEERGPTVDAERPATVVDGAWHRVRVRVEHRRDGEIRVRAWLDGESGELCVRDVLQGEWVGRAPVAELRVRTADPFAVREVRLQGSRLE